jgi:ABC-2 type transport system ATP-binding protein
VIHHGQILFDGELSALSKRFAATKKLVVTLDEPGDLSGYGEVIEATPSRAVLLVDRSEAARVTGRILAELAVNDLTVEDPPIEDVIEMAFASGKSALAPAESSLPE